MLDRRGCLNEHEKLENAHVTLPTYLYAMYDTYLHPLALPTLYGKLKLKRNNNAGGDGRSFLAAARHAFSERGIQNNRAEGRGDHTRSAGGVPLRGHKGSSKGSEQDAAQATCTLAACARRVALSLPFSA